MRSVSALILTATALVLAACGGDDNEAPASADQPDTSSTQDETFGRCDFQAGPDVPVGVEGLSCDEAQQALNDWPDFAEISPPLERCPHGYDTHVNQAIPCDDANRFVRTGFAPHPDGWVDRADDITCRIRWSAGTGSPLDVECIDTGEARFTFKFH